MKSLTTILIAFLLTISGCRKNSTPLGAVSWGETSHGVQISLSPNSLYLSSGEAGNIELAVKSVKADSLQLPLCAILKLYDEEQILRYLSCFDISAKNTESLYASSYHHPVSTLILAPDEQKYLRFDFTQLGWVTPVDSRPPYASFYDLVKKNRYTLTCELELTKDGIVRSNGSVCRIQ